MTTETILSIFLGVGLSTAVGFRIFVPLFALSLASYFELIPLNESWEWIGNSNTLIIVAIATLFEVFAYFIPWFDNLLDTIAVPLAAIAGTLVMVSTIVDLSPAFTWALAIIAGGGTASIVQGATTTTRLASTTTTGGIANPLITTVETGGAVAMSAFAIFFPFIAIILVVLLLLFLKKIIFKIFKISKRT